ncbi:MAG: helix-turn-helix domain-containing protein [Microcystaceae cyanobacterium]
MKKTKIELTPAEIERLESFINSGSAKAREIKHANVLLKLNEGWTQAAIATAFKLTQRTVVRLKQRCLEEGVAATLVDKPRSGAPKKITGEQKALVVASACSSPPTGHQRWTLRLLADKLVELELIESISHSSVGAILKKTNSNPGKNSKGVSHELGLNS